MIVLAIYLCAWKLYLAIYRRNPFVEWRAGLSRLFLALQGLFGSIHVAEEVQQCAVEGDWLGEMSAVSGVRDHHLLHVWNTVRECVRRRGDKGHFVIADDHERRHPERGDSYDGRQGHP